jgi:hypothetical protein
MTGRFSVVGNPRVLVCIGMNFVCILYVFACICLYWGGLPTTENRPVLFLVLLGVY